MSKFTDYCSSAITPQMTLLEKFNALMKYLTENEFAEKLYIHRCFNADDEEVFSCINTDKDSYNFETLNNNQIFNIVNSINAKYTSRIILFSQRSGIHIYCNYIDENNEMARYDAIMLRAQIVKDEVSEYTGA